MSFNPLPPCSPPFTDQEWDNLPAELRAVCLLRLLRRPVVRRWAHRVLGFPLSGPLTRPQLAAWCGVSESTILRWERDGMLQLRGAARRCGLTEEIKNDLINNH